MSNNVKENICWQPSILKNSEVFTNFWQPNNSYKRDFFNVDVSEEVTNRIKGDNNYKKCKELYPQSYIGQKANISVSVDNGKPYILREANGLGKSEFEVLDSSLIIPLFEDEELKELSGMAEEVRKNLNI